MRQVTPNSKLDRRAFLKVVALSGVGFAIGVPRVSEAAHHGSMSDFGPFVRISKDNAVTVVIKHLDKGQGVTTGLTAIVAEELDADWGQMRWEFAPADASRYNNTAWGPVQGTGGSSSIANSWTQLRQAGAAAKDMLVRAAAAEWGVPAEDITVKRGRLSHSSGKSALLGDFAMKAAKLSPPAEPALKTPEQFTLIGADKPRLPRIDSPEKTRGKAQYTIDVRLPGMLTAVMLHPSRFGATVKSVDDKAAKKIDGVRHVFTTPRGVAVVADHYWAAHQGREKLKVTWDESQAEQRSTEALWQAFNKKIQTAGSKMASKGDFKKAKDSAKDTVTLDFEFPFLAHATMEPMNCVAHMRDDKLELWTGSQLPTIDLQVAEKVTGVPQKNITMHTQLAGGSFGRRAVPDSDFVMEACLVAKALPGTPISLQWSREDDMRAGRYRPMSLHRFAATLDKEEGISGWHHRVVSQSLLRNTPFEGFIQGPIDPAITEGAANLPYAFANMEVDAHEIEVGVPVLWWRSVGHTHNAHATEVFLDEVAHAMKKDPVALRRELLAGQSRYLGVLELVAEKSKWGRKLPKNRAQGVAVHKSFNTYVAQVAEVTLKEDGSYSIDKIVCAVDCGVAITPDVIRAQIEGGIGYGLSAFIGEAVTLDSGKVVESNFHNYTPLRIHQMPEIEVHIVNSDEPPTGVGEPGTPPASPAVANALRVLTGKPITKMPAGTQLS